MSTLAQRIQQDLKKAMKARSETELSTLRLLKSDIQYEMNKTGASEISDEALQLIIKKALKKRKDAAEQYERAGRDDLAQKEIAEYKILESYLPEQVSDEEILKALDEVIGETGAAGPGDMGKVMGKTMSRFKERNIDGARVKELAMGKLRSLN